MSGLSVCTAVIFSLVAGYYGQATYAASGSGKGGTAAAGNAVSNSGSANGDAAAAGADVRLRAKFEVEAAVDDDTAPEFHADYRIKKGAPELKIRVENIEVGTVVDIFIQNIKIGSATVEADGAGSEASLDFKKGAWPAGLPTTLTAGMMVRVLSAAVLLFEAPFEVK